MPRYLILSSVICLFMLVGCESQPRPRGKPMADMTFAHMQPISLSVAEVKTSSSILVDDNIFPISPYEQLQDYVAKRFIPRATQGVLSFNVESATIAHAYEPAQGGISRFLDVGGYDVYDMRLQVRIEHLGAAHNILAGHAITVRRIVKVSEHASIAERESRQLQGAEGLFQSFDTQVQRIVLQEMNMGY